MVKQSYLAQTSVRITPFSYTKSSFTIKVNCNKFNNQKQIRAFMPNLVHSLDATSIALLVDYYFKIKFPENNIYTIHDCFAVTTDRVETLINLLKFVYLDIYSNENYLIKMDKEILHNIKLHFGEDCYDEKTRKIKVNDLVLTYPNINNVLGKQFDYNEIKKSSYLIN